MTYSPLHPDTLADPFSVYQELRQNHPVFWHEELHAWILSKYDDCKFALSDLEKFSRNPAQMLGLGEEDPEDMTIQSHDPPHSMPLRRAIAFAFERIDVEGICQSSGDELDARLISCLGEESFDFMSQVSAPVAIGFACRLIGLPLLPAEDYYSIFQRITRAMDSGLEPQRQKPGVIATAELNELVSASLATAPPGSIIYELLQDPRVQEMPKGYVRNTMSAMFNAAYSTAYTSMGSFLNRALTDPDLVKQITTCRSLEGAVQELLRLTSPAQASMRFAAQDLIIRGVQIKRTDPVVTLLASANHDSERFDRPGEFDPDRYSNAHLGFGWGAHFCVGAIPARTFLKHYLKRIDRCVSLVQLAGKPQWLDTVTLRCLKSLPLEKRSDGGLMGEFTETVSVAAEG